MFSASIRPWKFFIRCESKIIGWLPASQYSYAAENSPITQENIFDAVLREQKLRPDSAVFPMLPNEHSCKYYNISSTFCSFLCIDDHYSITFVNMVAALSSFYRTKIRKNDAYRLDAVFSRLNILC